MKKDLIEIRKTLSRMVFKFAEVTSTEGIIVIFDGDTLSEGQEVFTFDADGARVVLPNGTYTIMINDLETVIEVVDGVVATLNQAEPTVEEEMETEKEVTLSEVEEKFNNQLASFEVKLESLAKALHKINEAVLAFGSESIKDEDEKIEVKDKKETGDSPASKYFRK